MKNPLTVSDHGGTLVTPNTEMPPRGGNDKLTDQDVRRAVDYMLAITTGTGKN